MKDKTQKLLNIVLVLLVLVFITSTSMIVYFDLESKKNEDYLDYLREYANFSNEDEELYQKDNQISNEEYNEKRLEGYRVLKQQNEDMIGWIRIQNLDIIDYPVMYHPSEKEYYLRKSFDHSYNICGTPYVQEDCNPFEPSDNVIIYGHRVDDGTMFTQLLNYKKYDFYEQHKYIYFDSVDSLHVYEVFACLSESVNTGDDAFKFYDMINAENETIFNEYVEKAKRMSYIKCDVDVNYGDKLITLVTCDYAFDDGRCIVIAVRIK